MHSFPKHRPVVASTARLVLSASLLASLPGCTEDETALQIEGVVTDALTGEPIPLVRLTLAELQWKTSDRLAHGATDEDGEYQVVYTEDGDRCPAYGLSAEKAGYEMAAVWSVDIGGQPASLECTERVQRIDFALHPCSDLSCSGATP